MLQPIRILVVVVACGVVPLLALAQEPKAEDPAKSQQSPSESGEVESQLDGKAQEQVQMTEQEPGQVADHTLTVDAIVQRHLDARLADTPVQSIVAQGHLVFMGLQLPLTISIARPRSARLEADMAGSAMILAFDGESGWTVSPLQGIPVAEPLDEEAEEAVALFADFLWGLLDGAEDRGIEVALRGIEKVDADETYVLDLSGTQKKTIYLGGTDFLEHRLTLEAVFMGTLQQLDARLGDYRQVDGLMVPHDIQLLSSGSLLAQVVLNDVATNVPVDQSLFELPPPPPPATVDGASEGDSGADGTEDPPG